MITNPHFQNVKMLNAKLAQAFEILKKARASKNKETIEKTEIRYFQTVQTLYQGIENAVNNRTH